MFNKYWSFPKTCKFATVRQVYKKKRKTEISNYRPTSLLRVLSKILEIIVFKRLDQHVESNNILAIGQFSFRKGVNTESAIITLNDNILTSLNQQPDQSVGLCQP